MNYEIVENIIHRLDTKPHLSTTDRQDAMIHLYMLINNTKKLNKSTLSSNLLEQYFNVKGQ